MRPARPSPAPRLAFLAPVRGASMIALALWLGGCGGSEPAQKIIPGQMGLGKFCHNLNRGGQPVTLTLELGSPTIVTFTGRTGACSPPVNTPCTPIPVGRVPVRLLENGNPLAAITVMMSANHEYVFEPVVNSAGSLVISGGVLHDNTCQALDFPGPDGGFPAEAGAGDGGVADAGEAGGSDGGVADGGASDLAAADAGPVDAADDATLPVADAAASEVTAPDAAVIDTASSDLATD
jgi:hypothetical protein